MVLHDSDWQDLPGPLDLIDPHLADARVPDLPAAAVLVDHAQAVLEWRLRVDPVEVVELDAVGPQPAEALLDLASQHVGPALPRVECALGGNHDPLGEGRQGGTDRLLALAACVQVGGVDEVDPGGDRLLDERLVLGRLGQPVRAQPDPYHLGVAELQGRRHVVRPRRRSR